MEYTDINHQVFGGAHDLYLIYQHILRLNPTPDTDCNIQQIIGLLDVWFLKGWHGRIRTYDRTVKIRLLCQLNYMPKTFMAETVRFELTESYQPPTVFKTVALNHSATFPE